MRTIPAKSILQNVKYGNDWFGIDFNMNLYKGCCHGCIYCDSRSSCYRIDEFDSVRVKERAIEILERELMYKSKRGVVGIGAMSDTYNPFEKDLQVTRAALQLLERYGYGVSLETKSDLVVRDIDLISRIAAKSSAIIKMTITCADDALSLQVEPHVCPTSLRFQAIQTLSEAGIFTGVLMNPVLPFLTDTEENICRIVEQSAKSKAKFVHTYMGMTLRENQRDYYYQQLDRLYPGLSSTYQQQYRNKYSCKAADSRHLWHVFKKECERYGLLYRMEDIIHAYKKKKGEQLSLFSPS